MARSRIQRFTDTLTRRVQVPDDLESVASYGDEHGDPEVSGPIWEHIQRLYRTGMHPGIQVCIRHRGTVVLERSLGHARGNAPGGFRPDDALPMRTDTPVNLFSAAKAVSAMAMHKLEELGALSLDDTVAAHVPGFGGQGKGDITIWDVLSHRSGLPALPADAFDLDLLVDPDRIEARLCELEPEGAPGGPPAYNAVVGGFLLEAVTRRSTGHSLREILAAKIRDPLGLRWLDLGVAPAQATQVAHNVETGFPLMLGMNRWMIGVLGVPWAEVLEMSNDPRFLAGVIPSGNVIVTARDAAAFYQCLLNGGTLDGTRVFEEKTVARAIEPVGQRITIDRNLTMPVRYSAGFMLGTDLLSFYGWNHPRLFGHVGMSNLFTWADPDRDLVVALLTTGKPLMGTHLLAFARLLNSLHSSFPVNARSLEPVVFAREHPLWSS
jgi:CubicO group peptidase (beta-lactamase class C family)